MSARNAPAGRQRGFTLLEALVAMILLGLMMAVMTGSIRFAGQSRDAVTMRIDNLDSMRIAQDFLRQTIAQTHPKRWLKVVGRPYIFRGERDEMFLAAPLTARVGVGGHREDAAARRLRHGTGSGEQEDEGEDYRSGSHEVLRVQGTGAVP